MKPILRYFVLFSVFSFLTETAFAQTTRYKELHKVKRKETIFRIAYDNGITVQELIEANPEMNDPQYQLKKGDYIKIPYPSSQRPAPSFNNPSKENGDPARAKEVAATNTEEKDVRHRAIRLGVMLPLHNKDGDGKRMIEYYRGVLMACDSLRSSGISIDVRAWNLAENTDVSKILKDKYAADRDIIIGPLYSNQVKALGAFAQAHDIRVLIPFSINSQELYDNSNLFQVYQSTKTLNDAYVYRFFQRFKDSHVVIIDCNDTTSTKGIFTSALRRKLEQEGIVYSISNLKSSESMFKNCFSTTQRNVVVLNTGRNTEQNIAFAKLNSLLMTAPELRITMFGYPEWLSHTRTQLDNFYKFDTYIPSTYFMNPLSKRVEIFTQQYRQNFRQPMQNYPQRFAVTGFDHAFFFLSGLHQYGKHFTGATGTVDYTPLQTPLHFERIGNGGLQNRSILFVHYTKDNRIETIRF